MTDNTKSLIRHFLTALGTVVTLIGLNHWVPVLDYLSGSLDSLWDSVVAVIGIVTTLVGYFVKRDKNPAIPPVN